MPYVGKKPADIIATAVDTTTGTFSGDLTVDTSTLYVDSANNRVGVGTVSPSTKLEINGGTDNNIVRIVSTDANANIEFADNTTTSGLQIGANGDNMKFGISGAEVMRITSGGNVGIGTSSPASPSGFGNGGILHLKGSTNNDCSIVLEGLFSSGGRQEIGVSTGDLYFNRGAATGSMSTSMVIKSTGNVGIGTTSPSEQLHVSKQSNVNISVETTGSGGGANAGIRIKSVDGGDFLWQTGNATGNALRLYDYNSAAERMRIDNSGNLLVGKTTTALATAGITLGSAGFGSFTRSGNEPLNLNRLSSDGNMAVFYKDGSAKGSIGISSARPYMASNDSGLKFKNADITACTSTGADKDGSVSLGANGARFQNLYLSGGVYLGGTGSANYLDDYEEGVVTVSLSPDTSGTLTLNSTYDNLAYTKVGRMVTLTGAIVVNGISSPVGTYVRVLGLPFTVGVFDGLSERSGFSVTFFDQSINDYIVEPAFLTGSVTEFRIYRPANTWSASDSFYVNFSYYTS